MTSPVPSGIRGLSEERRTPRIGKVRLGVRELNKKPCRSHTRSGGELSCDRCTHPVMTDHFVFPNDAAVRQLAAMFGDSCIELPVAFPSDDPADFARRNLEMWGPGTLKCRGNGEIAQALVDVGAFEAFREAVQADPELVPPLELWASTSRAGVEARKDQPEPERRMIPCLGLGYGDAPACPKFEDGSCSPTMHVQVIVRGLPGLGTFQIDSGSVVNVQRLDDFLAYLGRYTGDRFAMVPLLLRLEPYEMRGRTYYGLNWDVDFPALEAGATTSVAEAARLTIPERVLAYLPAPTRQQIDEPPAAVEDGPASDAPVDKDLDAAPVEAPEDVGPQQGADRPLAQPEDDEPGDDDAPLPAEGERWPASGELPEVTVPSAEWVAARAAPVPVLGQVVNGRFGFRRDAPADRKRAALLAFASWAAEVPLLAPLVNDQGVTRPTVATIDAAGLRLLTEELQRFLAGEDIRGSAFPADDARQPELVEGGD